MKVKKLYCVNYSCMCLKDATIEIKHSSCWSHLYLSDGARIDFKMSQDIFSAMVFLRKMYAIGKEEGLGVGLLPVSPLTV